MSCVLKIGCLLLFLLSTASAQTSIRPAVLQDWLNKGNTDSILEYTATILSESVRSNQEAQLYYYRGQAFIWEERWPEAQQAFDRAEQKLIRNSDPELAIQIQLGRSNLSFYQNQFPQSLQLLESAERLATKYRLPELRFEIWQQRAFIYSRTGQPEAEALNLKQALHFARSQKDQARAVNLLNQLATNYFSYHQLDSAVVYFEQLIQLQQKSTNVAGLSSNLHTLGKLYLEQGNYPLAQTRLLEALRRAESDRDSFLIMSLSTDIAHIYTDQQSYGQALTYAQRGVDLAQLKRVPAIEATGEKLRGEIYEALDKPLQAIECFEAALRLFQQIDQPLSEAFCRMELAQLYRSQHNYQRARQNIEEAISVHTTNGDPGSRLKASLLLSELEIEEGNARASIPQLQQSLQLSRQMDSAPTQLKTLELLVRALEVEQVYPDALLYHKQLTRLRDSLNSVERSREVRELGMMYETEKKDRLLLSQQAELNLQQQAIQGRTNLLLSLGVAFLFLIIVGILLIYSYRKNQQLASQRFLSLKKQQEAQRLRALVEGEENERHRIARDLHDDLGALLAGVKMRISALSHEQPTLQSQPSYQRTASLIDTACRTIRQIAHNMVPEQLDQFGLEAAIAELCNAVEESEGIHIDFIPFGLEQGLSKEIQVSVFRIAQELIRNMVNHAEATEAIVQITLEDEQLTVVVEDNGIGFDPTQLSPNQGMGLDSIQSRVQLLDGVLHIDSVLERGTTFTIELPANELVMEAP